MKILGQLDFRQDNIFNLSVNNRKYIFALVFKVETIKKTVYLQKSLRNFFMIIIGYRALYISRIGLWVWKFYENIVCFLLSWLNL